MNRILTAIRDRGCRTSSEVALELCISHAEASTNMKHLETMGLIEFCGTYPKLAGESGTTLKMYEPTAKAEGIPPYDDEKPMSTTNKRKLNRDEIARAYDGGKGGTLVAIAKKFGVSTATVLRSVQELRLKEAA